MASFRPETFRRIWDLGPKFALYRARETLGTAAKPRKCRRFPKNAETYSRDRTGWLGREDSNLRMAESKSAYFPFENNAHSEKFAKFDPLSVKSLAAHTEYRRAYRTGKLNLFSRDSITQYPVLPSERPPAVYDVASFFPDRNARIGSLKCLADSSGGGGASFGGSSGTGSI
jgi:hypothetical protein